MNQPPADPAPIPERIPLGRTDLLVPPIGVGTWAWGDRLFWGYPGRTADPDLAAAAAASRERGLDFFDTAEIYGFGHSERLIGRLTHSFDQPIVIASKFFPYPWRVRRSDLPAALRGSLRRLGRTHVDLYQLHWPLPPVGLRTWVAGLADAVEAGLAHAVGVSNCDARQLRLAHAILADRGIPLASNQVEYSLLQRAPERNGVIAACRELGVTLIAYSPIAQGLLTGKYTVGRPPAGVRRWQFSGRTIARVEPLIGLLYEIGGGQGGKTPAQVALNWLIARGTLPIPGARNARQAIENAGAIGWRLSADEVAAIDRASRSLAG